MLGSDIEYPLRSNTLSAKSVLGGRVALTPFHSTNHVHPKSIVKEVQIDVMPPSVVGSLNILSRFLDTMEGVLGDL